MANYNYGNPWSMGAFPMQPSGGCNSAVGGTFAPSAAPSSASAPGEDDTEAEKNPISKVFDFGADAFEGAVHAFREIKHALTGSECPPPPKCPSPPVCVPCPPHPPPDVPGDVAAWATELGLGNFKSKSSDAANTSYAFENGTLAVTQSTGFMAGLDAGGSKLPSNVVDLSIQANLGAFKGTGAGKNGETTFLFANGAVLTTADKVLEGEKAGDDRDGTMKNLGGVVGFGNLQNAATDGAQRVYTFDKATVWTNIWTGAINGAGLNDKSQGFSGDVLNLAYARGFGGYLKTDKDPTGNLTFTFAKGVVHVTIVADRNGIPVWTVDSAKATA